MLRRGFLSVLKFGQATPRFSMWGHFYWTYACKRNNLSTAYTQHVNLLMPYKVKQFAFKDLKKVRQRAPSFHSPLPADSY